MCNCSGLNEHLLKRLYLTVHLPTSMMQEKNLLHFSPICINCPLSLQKQGVATTDDGDADVTGCICGSAGN